MNGRSMDCVFPICPVPVAGSVYTSLNETLVVTPYQGRGFKRIITKQVYLRFEGIVGVHVFAACAMIMKHIWAFRKPTCFRNVCKS
jgi:hypothetical protein